MIIVRNVENTPTFNTKDVIIFLHPTNNILLHHTSCFGFFSLYYISSGSFLLLATITTEAHL